MNTKIANKTLVLMAALVAGLPSIRTLDNVQAGDSLHPEALRFDWEGKRYRVRIIEDQPHAETIEGASGGILLSGPESRKMARYLELGLRKVAA
jgi:hypothetical protein